MNDKIHLNISKPFGPSLGKVNIPENLIIKINNYIDEVIEKNKEAAQLNDYGSSLAGQVKQEIRLPKEIVQGELLDYLISISKTYVKLSCGQEITKFELMSTWIVRQFENEYNPIHTHGGHISGVGYLKLPNNFGETFQNNKKNNFNGKLSLVHGSQMFSCKSTFTITPKVGDFYFFPNYLMHIVYPFYKKDEERRSISFNALIDENIYNSF